jgi:hypothetical protein
LTKKLKKLVEEFYFFAIFSPCAADNGGTQDFDLGIMSRVLNHCATPIVLTKLNRSKLKNGLASGSGTVVEHLAHYSEVKGISLTTVASTGREAGKKVTKTG